MSPVTSPSKATASANSHRKSLRKRLAAVWKRIAPILGHPILVSLVTAGITYVIPLLVRPSPAPIEALIKREAALASGAYPHAEKELDDYSKLFAAGAIVLDYRTKDLWQGKTAIVDRIRPLHFITLDHRPVNIHIDGVDASAESNTAFVQDKPVLVTGIGKEIWHFRKDNGTWEIISFEYDLP
jgi:hypothetical protein